MTNAQWAAIYAYCEEFGYTKREVLQELKANGVLDQNAKVKDIGDCVTDKGYDAMIKFLGENI